MTPLRRATGPRDRGLELAAGGCLFVVNGVPFRVKTAGGPQCLMGHDDQALLDHSAAKLGTDTTRTGDRTFDAMTRQ